MKTLQALAAFTAGSDRASGESAGLAEPAD